MGSRAAAADWMGDRGYQAKRVVFGDQLMVTKASDAGARMPVFRPSLARGARVSWYRSVQLGDLLVVPCDRGDPARILCSAREAQGTRPPRKSASQGCMPGPKSASPARRRSSRARAKSGPDVTDRRRRKALKAAILRSRLPL